MVRGSRPANVRVTLGARNRQDKRVTSIHAPTIALLLVAGGCAAPRPAPLPPPGRIHGHAFYGTPLTGTQPTAVADAGPAPAVQCELRYMYARDLPAVPPLAPNTRLFAGFAGDQPLHASLAAIAGAGLAAGETAVQTLREVVARADGSDLGPLQGSVPAGVTLSFDVELEARLDARPVAHGLVAVQVWQAAGASDADLGVAILVTDCTQATPTATGADADAHAPAVRRRLAVLERGLPRDGTPLALVVPSPFAGEQERALIAVLRATGPAPAHVIERTRAVADAAGALAAQRRAPADATIERGALEQAWAALGRAAQRRSALHTLARAGGAALVADLALTGDDALLAAFAEALPPGPLPEASGWQLERAACAFLGHRLDSDDLAAGLLAVLLRHTGEVGRAPGMLAEVLSRCRSLDDLAAGLLAENLAFLGDSDPAARVRAFAWLTAHGQAPANFAPLDERGARRAALRAAEAQAEVDR